MDKRDDYRRRAGVQDAVLADVDENVNWQVPARWLPEVERTFGSAANFALSLYPRWFAALTARLDPVLEERPAGLEDTALEDAAAREARRLARENRALFALLAAYAGHSAFAVVHERERQYLYWAPGTALAALAPQADDLLRGDLVAAP